MYKIIALSLSLIITTQIFAQSCGEEGQSMGILSQEDLNNWEYTGCKNFKGSISMQSFSSEGAPITDLRVLESLESIGGNLSIHRNDSLSKIQFLSKLKEIGGYLHIANNAMIEEISLEALEMVGKEIDISENAALVKLDGGNSLKNVGELRILSNKNLERISGFQALQHVGGDFSISANSRLRECSNFSHIDSIFGKMLFTGNLEIRELELLDSVLFIHWF